jgi:DNA-binding winged helix-turn-helix (wHTH) protein
VGGATFTIGGVVIDTVARRVTKAGQPEALTGREYALLEYLAHRRGAVVTRAELYEHLFDENEDTLSNLLEVHVCNLRRKLGTELIRTRRGMGYEIPAESLEHIFERFRRIDPEGSRHTEGAGLGLAIVKQAVEAHGGTIAVTSEVGRGTTFRVRLPVAV